MAPPNVDVTMTPFCFTAGVDTSGIVEVGVTGTGVEDGVGVGVDVGAGAILGEE